MQSFYRISFYSQAHILGYFLIANVRSFLRTFVLCTSCLSSDYCGLSFIEGYSCGGVYQGIIDGAADLLPDLIQVSLGMMEVVPLYRRIVQSE